jgi:hypothetical protein
MGFDGDAVPHVGISGDTAEDGRPQRTPGWGVIFLR